MASDSEAKYKGKLWKFIAGVLSIAFIMLSVAFCIACYIIITGGPSLDDVQKAHEEYLNSEGYHAKSVKPDAPSTEVTLYDLLGVDRDADMNEIDSSYLQLAKAAYPTTNNNNNNGENNSTVERQAFIHLAEAYQTLSDTEKRMNYDHDLNDGKIETKSDVKMSMDEAIKIYQAVEEKSKRFQSIMQRFQSIIGNLKNDLNHEGNESQVGIPSFPMVAKFVKMMGGPRIRVFKMRTRHRIRISKMCVNGRCRITVAHQVLKVPMQVAHTGEEEEN